MNHVEINTDTRFLSQTCCFTGHRRIPQAEHPMLKNNLRAAVEDAIQHGYRYFGAGGALEYDTLAAQTVLELKQTYPQIRLILVLPCESQTRGWSQSDVETYLVIRQAADKVVYTSKTYYNGCMHKRNRHLIDNSSLCICYMTNEHSGTGYTVRYAKEKECKIINLAKKELLINYPLL